MIQVGGGDRDFPSLSKELRRGDYLAHDTMEKNIVKKYVTETNGITRLVIFPNSFCLDSEEK